MSRRKQPQYVQSDDEDRTDPEDRKRKPHSKLAGLRDDEDSGRRSEKTQADRNERLEYGEWLQRQMDFSEERRIHQG